jgi:hypothetical protein
MNKIMQRTARPSDMLSMKPNELPDDIIWKMTRDLIETKQLKPHQKQREPKISIEGREALQLRR